ncbi:hypothetical protein FQA39_LY02392 [Lamprigera yunnana]|nr:hypothetical protein FQA39_LY02392 [Lamprigera yunnana]
MNLPELYVESGVSIRKDTAEMLKKYFKLLEVKEYCNVMDVGCGPGNVTHDLLYPLFPKTINELVAVDISPKMIQYARKTYSANSKIKFTQMDILTDSIPNNYYSRFDHITSFYCLHFINDQRKAFSNMFNMLKPGGNLLLSCVSDCIFYDIYKSMAEDAKWKIYCKNVKNAIPPTHFLHDVQTYFENQLKEARFEVHLCLVENKLLSFNKKIFAGMVLSVSLFNIPKSLEEEFVEYHLEYINKKNFYRPTEDTDMCIYVPHTLLKVFAKKSSFVL